MPEYFVPFEILTQIIDNVCYSDPDDRQTLASLRLASRTMSNVVTPLLFSSIKLHFTLDASIPQMVGLSQSPMASFVREIILTGTCMVPIDKGKKHNFEIVEVQDPDSELWSRFSPRTFGRLRILNEDETEVLGLNIDETSFMSLFAVRFMPAFSKLVSVTREKLTAIRFHRNPAADWRDEGNRITEAASIVATTAVLSDFDFPELHTLEFNLATFRSFGTGLLKDRMSAGYPRYGDNRVPGNKKVERRHVINPEKLKATVKRIYRFELESLDQSQHDNYSILGLEAIREYYTGWNSTGMEQLVYRGQVAIYLSQFIRPTVNKLTYFELRDAINIPGRELQDALRDFAQLRNLVLKNVVLREPGARAMAHYGDDFSLESNDQPNSRRVPWFVIFLQCRETNKELESFFFDGLDYAKDYGRAVSETVVSGEDEGRFVLRSTSARDHMEVLRVRDMVVDKKVGKNLLKDLDRYNFRMQERVKNSVGEWAISATNEGELKQ